MSKPIAFRDYIEVVPVLYSRTLRVKSPSMWFSNATYISVSKTLEYILIKKVNLDATKYSKKLNKKYTNPLYPHASFEWITELPLGKYLIEQEESNEDQIKIYLDTRHD